MLLYFTDAQTKQAIAVNPNYVVVVFTSKTEEGEFTAESNVVIIFPDHGSRYMSKVFSDDWMKDQGFFDSVNVEETQKVEFIK